MVYLGVAVLALGCLCSQALADGDPASDVLATQTLFLPQDAALPVNQQAELTQLLSTAARRGFPLRVAIITSPVDLGSITGLWHQPQAYAGFLGQELSLVYHGAVLIVMPNGFGFYGFGSELGRARAALAQVRLASGGKALGAAALSAVERLAAAAGHPLPEPTASKVASAPTRAPVLPSIIFAIGLALVLVAWTASFRARPVDLPALNRLQRQS